MDAVAFESPHGQTNDSFLCVDFLLQSSDCTGDRSSVIQIQGLPEQSILSGQSGLERISGRCLLVVKWGLFGLGRGHFLLWVFGKSPWLLNEFFGYLIELLFRLLQLFLKFSCRCVCIGLSLLTWFLSLKGQSFASIVGMMFMSLV